ncbi:hypothetical protein SAMN05660649_02963 [Desulfotomaculum arcticum]|uniref:DUF2062 domain-containing protein n=1 Tax=Desulfotruncus arcticus DSM 17038 TaxID=1121424 RepID=A0A1I2VJQ4_9FIRM|nr:DUF2062 domain-containing protein [Desulfotruncus arcticus]SFG87431.1 hypothetical protein SAMN05660649_02963 [Desulfotomaculum arcticum] [Desulfotruncus arcticus DSM 17038]
MSIKGRLKKYYTRVMDIPDAPVKVARGAAIGLAIDFMPVPIIGIPIAYVIARVVGGNGLAAALTATFFKWTVPFLYMLNIATGSLVMGIEEYDHAMPVMKSATLTPADWINYLSQFGYPFMVGAVINSILAWLLLYYGVRKLMMTRQKRKGIIAK